MDTFDLWPPGGSSSVQLYLLLRQYKMRFSVELALWNLTCSNFSVPFVLLHCLCMCLTKYTCFHPSNSAPSVSCLLNSLYSALRTCVRCAELSWAYHQGSRLKTHIPEHFPPRILSIANTGETQQRMKHRWVMNLRVRGSGRRSAQ